MIVTKRVRASATTTALHIPLSPYIAGRIITAPIWNTSVLRKDITAETIPLFYAVKKDEPNMSNPLRRKTKAYILNPCCVKLRRASS